MYKNELDNLEEGIREAIKYCSRHDILSEFLEINGSAPAGLALLRYGFMPARKAVKKE